MTAVDDRVAKRVPSLGELGGVHPSIAHLPATILEGTGDHEPDRDVAAKAAEWVWNHWDDDEWRNAFLMALSQHIENQVVAHRSELQAMLNQAKARTVSKTRRAIVKSYVDDVLEEVAKDQVHVRSYRRGGELVSGYNQERRNRGGGSLGTGRGTGGAGGYSPREGVSGVQGYDESYEDVPLEDQRRAGAVLAAQMLNAYQNRYGGDVDTPQQAEYTVVTADGQVKTFRPPAGQVPKLGKGDRIARIKGLGIEEPVTLGGDVFNVSQALGASATQAGSAGATAQHFHDIVNEQGGWGPRLVSASEAFHKMTGGVAGPPKAQAAVAIGKMVGKHGPEVTRVLGPHMRRYTYKYNTRGTQADPSQLTALARKKPESTRGEPITNEAYLDQLTLNLAKPRDDGGLQAIPTGSQAELMLKTGATAPSHGYIVDRAGHVRQQAHGLVDDHYVPFNLRDLHALNGGYYTRSRTYGGPTTEDIALAMKTGAQGFNVISRHGVYQVRFTPRTNKTGRKLGAWASDSAGDANQIMVDRYGRLLDAVKSGSLHDPDTGEALTLNGRGYEIALQSLQKRFPYYIRSVKYTPAKEIKELDGKRASLGDTDTGYVRPYYLKPSEAVQGYYDDLLGGHRSYDELDRYRLGKARVWYAAAAQQREAAEREAARQRRERDLTGEGRRRGGAYPWAREGAPAAPNPQAQRVANAGAGEFGAAERSTPATRPQEVWSGERVSRLVEKSKALIDHVGAGDPDVVKIQDLLNGEHSDDVKKREAFDDYYDALLHNRSGARDDLIDEMDGLQRYLTTQDHHGMELYQNIFNDEDLFPVDYSEGPQFETPEQIEQTPEHKRYQDWRKLFHEHSQYQSWKRTGREKLGPAKQEQYDKYAKEEREWEMPEVDYRGQHIGSKRQRMEVIDPETGLAEWQEHENRLARARGMDEPHQPAEEAVDEADTRQATHLMPPPDEDLTPEERRKQEDRNADQALRDLGLRPGDY